MNEKEMIKAAQEISTFCLCQNRCVECIFGDDDGDSAFGFPTDKPMDWDFYEVLKKVEGGGGSG